MRNQKEIKPLSEMDREYFHEFYEAQKKFIYYIARKYASEQADCDDLVQETTLRLLNNISSLRMLTQNKTAKYIALTVKSVFLDMEKRKQGEKICFVSDSMLERLLEIEALTADDQPSRMAVDSLKESLAPREWMVLEGKYLMGYSQEELAPMLGVSPDSVRMILCRARNKARNILQNGTEQGGDTDGQ